MYARVGQRRVELMQDIPECTPIVGQRGELASRPKKVGGKTLFSVMSRDYEPITVQKFVAVIENGLFEWQNFQLRAPR